ncbi:hypothetical protein [Burkholderia paludis]|uniref:hypothetical protein n=1 Tax=Burkholderia paludis TaxID=1506587 RepID=UPI000B0A1E5F|nr:hypothetical protein [Burkholderia paludis]
MPALATATATRVSADAIARRRERDRRRGAGTGAHKEGIAGKVCMKNHVVSHAESTDRRIDA